MLTLDLNVPLPLRVRWVMFYAVFWMRVLFFLRYGTDNGILVEVRQFSSGPRRILATQSIAWNIYLPSVG